MKEKPLDDGKYGSPNPAVKRLLKKFFRSLSRMLDSTSPERILEVGSGEGFVLEHVRKAKNAHLEGSDISDDMLRLARDRNPGLKISKASAYKLPYKDKSFDLVLAIEVLEHLEHPEKALKEIQRVCSGCCILSVPNEPIFSISNFLRARHIRRFGRNPDHIQAWSKKSFINLLSNYFKIKQVEKPFPWVMVLCECIKD